MSRSSLLAAVALSLSTVMGCAGSTAPPRVKVRLVGTPADAVVSVDDQQAGPLRVVQKLGLALTPGRHRITVEREGYFPWDRVVEATGGPLQLDVVLERLPE